MSNLTNDNLIEEAMDYINSGELSSTPLEKLIEQDIKNVDLDSLWYHVLEARNILRDDGAVDVG